MSHLRPRTTCVFAGGASSTNDTTPTFTGHVTNPGGSNASITVTIKVGGVTDGTAVTNASGDWTYTLTTQTFGTKSVTAHCTPRWLSQAGRHLEFFLQAVNYAAATEFNGTTNYLTRGADLTGVVDGKKGILFLALKMNGGDGLQQRIFCTGSAIRFSIIRHSTNQFLMQGLNAAGTVILSMATRTTFVATSGWRSILASWDLATGFGKIFLSDVNDTASSPTLTNDTLDYTTGNWGVGSATGGGLYLNACVARFYFNSAESLDITLQSNRRKFFDAAGGLKDLGADGSTPTGTAPAIYLPNAFGTIQNNAGTGGNFTAQGTFAACATGPLLARTGLVVTDRHIADQVIDEDLAYSYTFGANVFVDSLGTPLTFTATLDDDEDLPAWLTFDGPTRTFTGTAEVGLLAIKVTAFNGTTTASDTFNLQVDPGEVIALSASTVAEDAAIATTVGNLSVLFGSGSYTFTLLDDALGTFSIVGAALKVAAALDFETAPSPGVTVNADNGSTPAIQKAFTITVTDVNEGGIKTLVITGLSGGATSTFDSTPTIYGTYNDSGGVELGVVVTIKKDGISQGTTTVAANGTWNFDFPTLSAAGSFSIIADAIGGTVVSNAFSLTYNDELPTIPVRVADPLYPNRLAPRLYMDAARLTILRDRYTLAKASLAGGLKSDYVSEYSSIFTSFSRTESQNAALHWLCAPADLYSGTLNIGSRREQAAVPMVFTNAPYWKVALAVAWYDMTETNYVSLFEMFQGPNRAAIVYDYCYTEMMTGGAGGTPFLNPVTGNTYVSDLHTELIRVSRIQDQPGWPGGLGVAADPFAPIPNPSLTYANLPNINGHVAHASVLCNHLSWGLAIYDEDRTLWNAALALTMGGYKVAIDWIAQGHGSASDSNYYTMWEFWVLAAFELKFVGITNFLPDNLKYVCLYWLMAVRPDGKMLYHGDQTDDDGWSVRNRTMMALLGSWFQTDPIYGPLASYLAYQDNVDWPVGTLSGGTNGPIVFQFWQEDNRPGARFLTFCLVDQASRTAVRNYHPGLTGHPHFDNVAKVHHFPFPFYKTILRTGWNLGNLASNVDGIAELTGGSYQWSGHQHRNHGTWQMYFKGPLTGHFFVYQSSGAVWGTPYNVNFAKQGTSHNTMLIYDKITPEISYVKSSIASIADGGPRWPQPWRFPDDFTSTRQRERSNADQPSYISWLTVSHGANGLGGYRLASPIGHWEKSDYTVAFIATDSTAGYRSEQSDRANKVERRQLAIKTGNATAPLVIAIADFVDAKNVLFQKRWIAQCIDTPVMDDVGRIYYWRNDTRPGTTSPLTDQPLPPNPNDQGYYFHSRYPKFVGSYDGRCTVHSLFPAAMTSEYVNYGDGAGPGTGPTVTFPTPLRRGAIKSPVTDAMVYYDPGKKGQNISAGNSYPNKEEGFGRIEIKASGQAKDDFLHIIVATAAGTASPAVTKYDVTGVMGFRFVNSIGLFRKDGGNIGFEGAGTYATGITIAGSAADVCAAVAAGEWQVKIGGVQVGEDYSVSASERFLFAPAVPVGALTLVNTVYADEFAITSGSASGSTGKALYIDLTANFPVEEWALVSGSNGIIDGGRISLMAINAPGTFTFVVSATDASGLLVTKTFTMTLSGAPTLGAIANFAVADMTTNSATFSFTAVSGATGYQVAVNGDTGNPRTLTAAKVLAGVLSPSTLYTFEGRAFDSAVPPNFGPWSTSGATGTTDAVVDPGPEPGVLANRARTMTDGAVLQFRLNLASSVSPHRTSTGWIAAHVRPLTDVGLTTARTIFGGAQPRAQILLMAAAPYNMKFDLVLNSETSTANDLTLIEQAHSVFPTAVSSFQGLNEPNHNQPAGWAANTIAHTIAIWNKIRTYPAFNNVTVGSFSPWGRLTTDMTAILAAGWLAQCSTKFDWLNLHYYTGARQPHLAGAPDGTVNENGNPIAEVALGALGTPWPGLPTPLKTINDLERLGPGKPMRISEMGWNLAEVPGAYWPQRSPSIWWVGQNAQAKYGQVMLFEAFNAGITKSVWFELIENFTKEAARYGMLKYPRTWPGVDGSDGPFTRTKQYTVCLNTAAAFYDSGATSRTFTPGTLNYSLSGAGNDATIQHRLFQKSDGKFLLAIWQRHMSHSRTSFSLTTVAPPVKSPVVNFGQFVALVRSNRPYNNQTWTNEGTNIASKAFTIPDDVLVLEITE